MLDGKNYFPHISIYPPEFPEQGLDKIISEVIKISKSVKPFKLTFKDILYEEGFLGINFKNDKKVKELHLMVLESINPLREDLMRDKYKDKKFLGKQTKIAKGYIIKYGYPRVLDLYIPHLTLIRFDSLKSSDEVISKIKWDKNEIEVSKLGIFEMGDNGTCIKLIKEIFLNNE